MNRDELMSILRDTPRDKEGQRRLSARIEAFFKEDATLAKTHLFFGNGLMLLQFILPKHLVRLASLKNETVALDWLERILASSCSRLCVVMPLWGLIATQVMKLGDNLSLVPIQMLPASNALAELTSGYVNMQAGPTSWSDPTSALVMSFEIPPTRQNEDWGDLDYIAYAAAEMYQIRRCLGISGPYKIASAHEWFQYFEDPFVELGNLNAMSRHEDTRSFTLDVPQFLDTTRAIEVLQALKGMSGKKASVAFLVIDRFERAMRRMDPGDAAVELAIALEAMLVSDGQGELSHKISLRAARLVAGTLDQMTATRTLIKAVYDLRSKVVHTGVAPRTVRIRGRGEVFTSTVITETLSIVSEVFRLWLLLPNNPDWFTIELGTTAGV